jgi:hypothetical protein
VTRWYQFCICDIVSMLRMSMHGVRMFTEPIFCRGRHGQESEEDRESSHQESGEEDLKEEEEVTVSTTEKLPPPGRNPDAKRNLSKGSEMSFAGSVLRQGSVSPDLYAAGYCIKVRFLFPPPARA